MMPQITLGTGLKQPHGRRLEVGSVEGLAKALAQVPPAVEAWWAPHVWRGDARDSEAWESSCAIALDVDREGHSPLPEEHGIQLEAAARGGQISGSVLHRTPAGARVIFFLAEPCRDAAAFAAAARGAAESLMSDLRELDLDAGLSLDPKPHSDLARLYFTPNSIAKGVHRSADLVVIRREPYRVEDLAAPPPADTPAPSPTRRPVLLTHDAAKRARAYIDKMGPSVEGNRGDDHGFRVAAVLVNDFALSADEAWAVLYDWNASCQPPWPERDLKRFLRSAERNAKGVPGNKLDDDRWRRVDAISRASGQPAPEPPPTPAPDGEEHPGLNLDAKWISFSLSDLERDPPRKEFIWDGRIPRGDVGVFSASGSSGKTALLTGLALHRAMGRPFLGKWARPGTTVIVTTEDSKDDYLRKVAAWKQHLQDVDLVAITRHVHIIDLHGEPFRLVRSHFGDFVPTDHPRMLAETINRRAPGADLVIVETVSRVGGDESNEGLSALVVAAEQLAKLTQASVLLVSHVSQDAGRRGVGDQYAPRGGTAIGDNGRYTITLARLLEDDAPRLLPGVALAQPQMAELWVLRVPKINSAPPQDDLVVQRVPTQWGLALRVYEAGQGQNEEERKGNLRRSIGLGLAALAARVTQSGRFLTVSLLSKGLFKEVPGLSQRRIDAALMEAIEDGHLQAIEREGRGGGTAYLPGRHYGTSSDTEEEGD